MKNPQESFNFNENNNPENSGFDPEKDFLKLKNINKDDASEKIKEFKDNLRKYKEVIASMGTEVFKYLEEVKEIDYKHLEDIPKRNIVNFKISEGSDFIKSYREFIKNIKKREDALTSLVSDCLDNQGNMDANKIFEKLFYKEARGNIKIEKSPINIYIRMEDGDDFVYVCSGAYKKKREVNEDDIEDSASCGGMCLLDYPQKKLRGAILIENPAFFNDDDLSFKTRSHENQHSLNSLIDNISGVDHIFGYRKFDELKKIYERNNTKEESLESEVKSNEGAGIPSELLEDFSILIVENPAIEEKIRGEITAYLKDGSSSFELSKRLLEKYSIYNYGLFYDIAPGEDESGDFTYKYMKLVENGIIAFAKLLDDKYSYEAVHSILYLEPLSKWLKVLERFTGKKLSKDEYLNLEKKYIDPEIIKDIEEAKKYADLS